MPDRFDKFVHDENIKNFTRQIETETDPAKLVVLKSLLSEEQTRETSAKSGRANFPAREEVRLSRPAAATSAFSGAVL